MAGLKRDEAVRSGLDVGGAFGDVGNAPRAFEGFVGNMVFIGAREDVRGLGVAHKVHAEIDHVEQVDERPAAGEGFGGEPTAEARDAGATNPFRLAGIYGPGRHHLLDQLQAGATVFSGSGVSHLNLIHRDDSVSAIMAGLEAPALFGNEIFNVTDGQPARRAEVGAWLATQLGASAPMFDGTVKTRRGGGLTPDRQISSLKIQQMLGWQPQFPDYRAGYRAILGRP